MKFHNYMSNNSVTNKGGVECISILIEVIRFTNFSLSYPSAKIDL